MNGVPGSIEQANDAVERECWRIVKQGQEVGCKTVKQLLDEMKTWIIPTSSNDADLTHCVRFAGPGGAGYHTLHSEVVKPEGVGLPGFRTSLYSIATPPAVEHHSIATPPAAGVLEVGG